MPKEIEEALKREARRKFKSSTSKRARAYVYGAMRKSGWRPSRERKRDDVVAPASVN